jgi:hypothetical protein
MSCSLGHCTSVADHRRPPLVPAHKSQNSGSAMAPFSAPNGPVPTRSTKVPCRTYRPWVPPWSCIPKNSRGSTTSLGKKLCGSRDFIIFIHFRMGNLVSLRFRQQLNPFQFLSQWYRGVCRIRYRNFDCGTPVFSLVRTTVRRGFRRFGYRLFVGGTAVPTSDREIVYDRRSISGYWPCPNYSINFIWVQVEGRRKFCRSFRTWCPTSGGAAVIWSMERGLPLFTLLRFFIRVRLFRIFAGRKPPLTRVHRYQIRLLRSGL